MEPVDPRRLTPVGYWLSWSFNKQNRRIKSTERPSIPAVFHSGRKAAPPPPPPLRRLAAIRIRSTAFPCLSCILFEKHSTAIKQHPICKTHPPKWPQMNPFKKYTKSLRGRQISVKSKLLSFWCHFYVIFMSFLCHFNAIQLIRSTCHFGVILVTF